MISALTLVMYLGVQPSFSVPFSLIIAKETNPVCVMAPQVGVPFNSPVIAAASYGICKLLTRP